MSKKPGIIKTKKVVNVRRSNYISQEISNNSLNNSIINSSINYNSECIDENESFPNINNKNNDDINKDNIKEIFFCNINETKQLSILFKDYEHFGNLTEISISRNSNKELLMSNRIVKNLSEYFLFKIYNKNKEEIDINNLVVVTDKDYSVFDNFFSFAFEEKDNNNEDKQILLKILNSSINYIKLVYYDNKQDDIKDLLINSRAKLIDIKEKKEIDIKDLLSSSSSSSNNNKKSIKSTKINNELKTTNDSFHIASTYTNNGNNEKHNKIIEELKQISANLNSMKQNLEKEKIDFARDKISFNMKTKEEIKTQLLKFEFEYNEKLKQQESVFSSLLSKLWISIEKITTVIKNINAHPLLKHLNNEKIYNSFSKRFNDIDLQRQQFESILIEYSEEIQNKEKQLIFLNERVGKVIKMVNLSENALLKLKNETRRFEKNERNKSKSRSGSKDNSNNKKSNAVVTKNKGNIIGSLSNKFDYSVVLDGIVNFVFEINTYKSSSYLNSTNINSNSINLFGSYFSLLIQNTNLILSKYPFTLVFLLTQQTKILILVENNNDLSDSFISTIENKLEALNTKSNVVSSNINKPNSNSTSNNNLIDKQERTIINFISFNNKIEVLLKAGYSTITITNTNNTTNSNTESYSVKSIIIYISFKFTTLNLLLLMKTKQIKSINLNSNSNYNQMINCISLIEKNICSCITSIINVLKNIDGSFYINILSNSSIIANVFCLLNKLFIFLNSKNILDNSSNININDSLYKIMLKSIDLLLLIVLENNKSCFDNEINQLKSSIIEAFYLNYTNIFSSYCAMVKYIRESNSYSNNNNNLNTAQFIKTISLNEIKKLIILSSFIKDSYESKNLENNNNIINCSIAKEISDLLNDIKIIIEYYREKFSRNDTINTDNTNINNPDSIGNIRNKDKEFFENNYNLIIKC